MSALLPAPGLLARRRPPLPLARLPALPVVAAAAAAAAAAPPTVAGRRFFAASPPKAPPPAPATTGGERNSTNLFQAPKGHPPGIGALLARYRSIPLERTRCFAIIAHIDHGKSTLSDKLLEATANIWPTVKGAQQVLDTLEVERARGITVKAQSASMVWSDPRTGLDYLLNLIDTPGHVDFAYEVSRSLAACQGALLLVDASQGVQAQTVANHNAAAEAGLTIIPVLTKIDLPTADPEPALTALEGAFGVDANAALWTSAKTGAGIADVFPAVVDRLPPPPGGAVARSRPLRALLFDSWFDAYRGVVCSVLVVEGVLRPGDVIVAAHSGDKFTVQEVGLMAPAKVPLGSLTGPGSGAVAASAAAAAAAAASDGAAASSDVPPGCLGAGHMGYMIAGMKSTKQAVVGDTFFSASAPVPPLPGFAPAKPMVFASLYPVDTGDFGALVTAVERLTLNDASVGVERESSSSLGLGLRCGFLGLLHMDVFVSRLQSEFETPVIITAPMVAYRLVLTDGTTRVVERPGDFPPAHNVARYYEPTAHVSIMTPSDFVSPLMGLMAERRGVQEDVLYLNSSASSGGGSNGANTVAAAAASATPRGRSSEEAGDGTEGEPSPGAGAALSLDDAPDLSGDAGDDDEEEDGDDADGDEEEEDDDGSAGLDFSDGGDKPTGYKRYSRGGGSSSSAAAAVPSSSISASSPRVVLKYRLPWSEVVTDLYDAVKSLTAGYASVDWLPGSYQQADVVKVDVLVNTRPVDALCFVAHKDRAVSEGRRVAAKLKAVIARQQFEIVIQAAVGSKVFARERIAPYRKDVLTKGGKTVGGGDVSRKQKLLAKQREGKKRMKTVGNVQLSQEAFHSIMTSR